MKYYCLALVVLAVILTGCASDPERIAKGQETIIKAKIKQSESEAERERKALEFQEKLDDTKAKKADAEKIRKATFDDRVRTTKAWYTALSKTAQAFAVGSIFVIGAGSVAISGYLFVIVFAMSRNQLIRSAQKLNAPRLNVIEEEKARLNEPIGTMTLVQRHAAKRREESNVRTR